MHTIYRWLLRTLPQRLREGYGQEMQEIFEDRVRDHPRPSLLYMREIASLLAALLRAPRESPFRGLGADLRAGFRALGRSPRFALTAGLMLAIGIGGSTAMFSMLDQWILRPLPFPAPDRLMDLTSIDTVRGFESLVSAGDFAEWQTDASIERLAGWNLTQFNLSSADAEPERVPAARVTGDFFRVLGVAPAIGRDFLPEEDAPGAPHSVIITDELWRTRFFGDPQIIGRTISLDDEPATIAGVLPPHFQFTLAGRAQMFEPWSLTLRERADHEKHFLVVIARRRAGVAFERARETLAATAKSLEARFPASNTHMGVRVVSLADEVGKHQGNQVVWVIFGLTIFVLLIVCSNVANLVLARSVERQKEVAVRFALGASRGRVIRQILIENVVLFLAAAGASVIVAIAIAKWISEAVPVDVRPWLRDYAQIHVSYEALAFAAALALLTGVLFGVAPALEGSRADVNQSLKEGSGRGSTGRGGRWMGNILVAGELALALALLVAGGLLITSLKKLWLVEPGFDPQGVLPSGIVLSPKRYPDPAKATRAEEAIVDRLRAVPGVTAAALSQHTPFGNSMTVVQFWIEGRPDPVPGEVPGTNVTSMTPGYLAAMRIPLLAGRDITERDDASSPKVVLVNELFARRQFPGESPIGKHIRLDSKSAEPAEIIGLVKNTKLNGLDDRPQRQAYVPLRQRPARAVHLVIRAADPLKLAPAMRASIHEVDSGIAVAPAKLLSEEISDTYTPHLITTQMVSAFSLLALAIAATGLYAVMAWSVSQRTRELGIRVALGAARSDVYRMVLGRAGKLVAVGIVAGLVFGAAMSRLLTMVLYDVSPYDPAIFSAVTIVLVLVALAASYLPARRASRLDPLVALRHE
jgi:putative ABC transport system permease protein